MNSRDDYNNALRLLMGERGDNGKKVFLSGSAEKEARRALARILRSGDVDPLFLGILAAQIEPGGNHKYRWRRIEFKRLNQGHGDLHRDISIAMEVSQLRQNNERNAVDSVAKKFGVTPRQVSRICQKIRAALTPVRKQMS
jgi:hypothetical protein